MVVNYDGRMLEIKEAKGHDMLWRNFRGLPTKFTKDKMWFNIVLPEEAALDLMDDGWKIKKHDDDPEDIFYTLKVNVNFNYKPMKIFRISNGRMVELRDREEAGGLDYDKIKEFECVIMAYRKPEIFDGVSASLETLWVEVSRSDLYDKYGSMYGRLDEIDDEMPFES